MVPTDKLQHHFAAGFRPANSGRHFGLPFPLDALWPILPLWVPGSNSGFRAASIGNDFRHAFQDLKRHGLSGLFKLWGERMFYRRELLRLVEAAPHMIDDIGLTCDQALAEAHQPFWRG